MAEDKNINYVGMRPDGVGSSLVEESRITAKKIREANSHAANQKNMLVDSVGDGEITFSDALEVARDLDLLTYSDPKDDKIGDEAVNDMMRMYIWNYREPISQPYNKANQENNYIINQIVLGNLRLPQAIEVTRTLLAVVEGADYSKSGVKDPQKTKKEKIERLSKDLYALTDFQTTLIADELVEDDHADWKAVREKISKNESLGQSDESLKEEWEQTRKKVVEWSGIQSELEQKIEGNERLRSLVERPITEIAKGEKWFTSDKGYDDVETTQSGQVTPVDPMVNNVGVKRQAEKVNE